MHNRVETRIAASPEIVWGFISDFSRYSEWNVFTPSVTGRCAAGEIVQVLVRLDGEPFTMARRILAAETNRHFSWEGKAWYSFLCPGQRSLTLEPQSDGTTLLVDDEQIGGISWMMPRRLGQTIFQRMNEFGEGLKSISEKEANRRHQAA